MCVELKDQVRKFYDDFHLNRKRDIPRKASSCRSFWKGRVLEIGGGTLVPEGFEDYTLVDISWSSIYIAKGNNIKCIQGDGERLPFKNASFDTAYCFNVLEHTPSPVLLINEMCRVSSSKVIIAGPNYIGISHRSYSKNIFLRKIQKLINLFKILLGYHKKMRIISNPHLIFDEQWDKDKDAVSAVNVYFVENILIKNGFKIERLYLDEKFLDKIWLFRYIGEFMCVVAYKG